MFFESWALWEKMTFVLALAIVAVFFMGWGKLLWVDRYIKKHKVADEEKRQKIQELRDEGHIIESSGSHDIPFGVRAIQSGIQVDGIWISQSATPAQSEFRLGRVGSSSSDPLASDDSGKDGGVTVGTTAVPESPKPLVHQFRGRDLGSNPGGKQEAPVQDSRGARTSYKPRRSSHLRYGSSGGHSEVALDRLEGHTAIPKKKLLTRQPRGSRQTTDTEADSSAADNERNSATSDDSDATLSKNNRSISGQPRQTFLDMTGERDKRPRVSSVSSGKPVQASVPTQSSRVVYDSVPIDSPGYEYYDPFNAANVGTPEGLNEFAQTARPLSEDWYEHTSSVPVQAHESPRFIPGELHANKTLRKVNSGFEVLPAGTFGVPDSKGKGKEVEYDEEGSSSNRRQSMRLQKKPRNSLSSRRPSMDH